MSLRELLILVAFVALLIASLKYASDVWLAIVAAVTMLAFFTSVIVAVVDRGPRQAVAIGFALTMFGYSLIVMASNRQNREFDQWEGRLPTTRLLRYVHMAVDNTRWIDLNTGKEIPGYDPNTYAASVAMGISPSWVESPPREFFMPIGHCWWALVLGYLGGWFALFVNRRRMREQAAAQRPRN